MRFLVTVLALSLMVFGLSSSTATHAAPAASSGADKSAKDYISKIRIGGWVGDNALLVLPDRTAAAVPIGSNFGGAKLVEIGNNSFTIDYGGVQNKVTLDPWWQLAPHPDLTNWIIQFMKDVGNRIDAQVPDCSHESVIRVDHDGKASGDNIKVQQAIPFQKLPDWMETIDIKISINPHDPTKVQFMSMVVTPQAFDRLSKPMTNKYYTH